MVSSTSRKIVSLAISLLVVVISLANIAMAATAPTVTLPTTSRYFPGLAGAPGKMARDAAGNFYVADFWGKGIVKLDRTLAKIGFIPTNGRPSAVTVAADNRLVVAIAKPVPKIAFYKQFGSAPSVSGEEDTVQVFDAPASPIYNPTAVTFDSAGYVYLLDSGDNNASTTVNVPTVRVYDNAGVYKYAFGVRTAPNLTSTAGGTFKLPMSIAYERASNRIMVVDTLNGRIQSFIPYDGASCVYDSAKSFGSLYGNINYNEDTLVGAAAKFYNPTDIAFEYSGAALSRMYVGQRGRNFVSVIDASGTYGRYLSTISASKLTGADMKLPSAVVFENNTVAGGFLYVANAPGSTPANILKLIVDSGSAAPSVALSITTSVGATSSSPLALSGTVNPSNPVSCNVNSGADIAADVTGTTWSIPSLVLATGNNYIVCKTTAAGVTTYADAKTFTGATQGQAVVAIVSPADNSFSKNSNVVVSGTTTVGNSTVVISGGAATATTVSNASGAWSTAVALTEGLNTLSAVATKAGVTDSAPVTRTVKLDSIAPAINLSFIPNASTTTNPIQNLDAIVSDVNLATITVNGVPVDAVSKVALSLTDAYVSVPVTLSRGSNNVTVEATDLAGNKFTVTRTVSLNQEIGSFGVNLPADNSYRTATGAFAADGTAANFDSVDAAGSAATPANGVWNVASVSVVSGFQSYLFTATKGATTVSEKRTVNTAPAFLQAAITSPAVDSAKNSASVTISGALPASSPVPVITLDSIVLTGVAYDSVTGLFSKTVTLQGEGSHVVRVKSGSTEMIRNVILDTVNPDITLQADSKVMPSIVYGTVEPSAKISSINASLHSAPVSIPLSVITFTDSVNWNANLTGYAYDTLSFTSADPAGNTATLSYVQGVPSGDIDGDGVVRLSDALAALRHVAGTEKITDTTKFFEGDVGGLVNGRAARDGSIDITDTVLILNKAYGLVNF